MNGGDVQHRHGHRHSHGHGSPAAAAGEQAHDEAHLKAAALASARKYKQFTDNSNHSTHLDAGLTASCDEEQEKIDARKSPKSSSRAARLVP